MADLDLSKLLKTAKKPAADVAPEETPAEPETPVAEAPAPTGGLDLSKLIAKAKAAAEPAVKPETAPQASAPVASASADPAIAAPKTAAVAQGPVTLTGKLSFSEPAKEPAKPVKPFGVGGQRMVGQVGQAGGVAKTKGQLSGAFSAPATGQTAPAKALAGAAPSNKKLEAQMSRHGLEIDRLNIVQKEERKYPAGYFGVDEIFLAIQDTVNVVRANLWRALDEYPRFSVGAKIMGSVRRDVFCIWDGEKLEAPVDKAPDEPTAWSVVEADDIIDNTRGKLSCALYQASPRHEMHGDVHLGRVLRMVHVAPEPELVDEVREREEARLAERLAIRKRCKTPAEWVQRLIELRIQGGAPFIQEPIFFRVTLQTEPKQEILFHIEKGKLTTLVGKEGETLLEGALEVTLSAMGVQGLWDMECDWPFLFSCGQARASGDVDLLSRLYWVNFEIVRRIRLFNRTQQVPSVEHPIWIDVRMSPPPGANK